MTTSSFPAGRTRRDDLPSRGFFWGASESPSRAPFYQRKRREEDVWEEVLVDVSKAVLDEVRDDVLREISEYKAFDEVICCLGPLGATHLHFCP